MEELDIELQRLLTGATIAGSVAEKIADPREAALVAVLGAAALNHRAGISLDSFLEVAEKAYEVFVENSVEELWESLKSVDSTESS